MSPFTHYKRARSIDPQVVDNATATSYVIDTLGTVETHFVFNVGTTDIAMTTLKVQESDSITDATTLDTGADITGLVLGTSVDPIDGSTSALPSATDDGKAFAFSVKNQGRKRYLQVIAVAGNGTTGVALGCQAFQLLEEGPSTSAERGYLEHLTT